MTTPSSLGGPARRVKRTGRRLWIIALVVVLLAAAAVVAATRSSAAPAYRTAVAGVGDVQVTLDSTGTIQPVTRADLTFPVSGSVAGISVALGQHVTAGEVLATLDTTALGAQVASAQSQVASAKAKLAADRSGQAGPGAQSPAGGAVPAAYVVAAAGRSGTAEPDPAPAAGSGPAHDAVEKAQDAVLDHQHAADTALATVQTDLAAAQPACTTAARGPADPGGSDPGGPGSGGSTADGSTAEGPATAQPAAKRSGDGTNGAGQDAEGDTSACRRALAQVLTDETAASDALKQVTTDETALDKAVQALVAAMSTTAGGRSPSTSAPEAPASGAASPGAAAPGGAAGTGAPAGPGRASGGGANASAPGGAGGDGRTGGSSSGGSAARAAVPVSAEQLAADQAAVDSAAAQLTVAQQDLGEATLTSPIDGTIGAIAVTAGQQVSAGSGTPQLVVLSAAGGYQAQVTVGETDVSRVAVGDKATITPDGATAPVDGTVSAIGLLPSSAASSGAASYDVTIALAGSSATFPAGQGAAVGIRLSDVSGVLTVPTSAVHTNGPASSVDVLRNGSPTPAAVQVGAVGAQRTQITAGLAAGDVVVVADPSQPLPSAGTTALRGLGGAGGGAVGGGLAGGGARPGR